MLIAILVLLGIACAIWYFARQQAQAVVTLTQEDVNVTSVTNESAFTTPEVASEKEFIQAQQDALDKAQKAASVEAAPAPVVDPIVEAPVPVVEAKVETPAVETKPKKKKRYYKPKAK